MAEFEERLRDALRARAREVEPDPAVWERVAGRIQRGRILGWAAPATAVVAVAAVAVLVVPSLLPGDDIEFRPADDADEAQDADDSPGPEPLAEEPEPQTEAREPTPLPETPSQDETAPDEEPAEPQTVTAYFVRQTEERLSVEATTVALDTPTVGVARVAMEALVGAAVGDLETLAPQGTRVLGASVQEGVLRVDLSPEVREGDDSAGREEAFAQQLAHTAAQFDEIESVRLLVQGVEVDELWGHLDWSQPIEPDELALSPIVIGEAVIDDGHLEVAGEATTYEGTVELMLVGPGGVVKEETFATADCGAPCRGEWSHTFELPADTPGTWEVEASEPDVTDEGPAPFSTGVRVRAD